MLSSEKMKEAVQNFDYMLEFVEETKEVYLIKHRGDVKISTKRAIEWVEAGIDDLECRTKEEMLTLLKKWL